MVSLIVTVASAIGCGGSSGGGAGSGGHGGSNAAGTGGRGGSNAAGTAGGNAGSAGGSAGSAGGNAGTAGGSAGTAGGSAGTAGGSAGSAGGAAGQDGVSYLGCTYIGGIDRIVVAKRDSIRDLCFNVVLNAPGLGRQEIALPNGFGLEHVGAGPASICPSRSVSSVQASLATGTIESAGGQGGATGTPTHVNIDVALTFPANDAGAPPNELMQAQNVDVEPACQ